MARNPNNGTPVTTPLTTLVASPVTSRASEVRIAVCPETYSNLDVSAVILAARPLLIPRIVRKRGPGSQWGSDRSRVLWFVRIPWRQETALRGCVTSTGTRGGDSYPPGYPLARVPAPLRRHRARRIPGLL